MLNLHPLRKVFRTWKIKWWQIIPHIRKRNGPHHLAELSGGEEILPSTSSSLSLKSEKKTLLNFPQWEGHKREDLHSSNSLSQICLNYFTFKILLSMDGEKAIKEKIYLHQILCLSKFFFGVLGQLLFCQSIQLVWEAHAHSVESVIFKNILRCTLKIFKNISDSFTENQLGLL